MGVFQKFVKLSQHQSNLEGIPLSKLFSVVSNLEKTVVEYSVSLRKLVSTPFFPLS